MLKGCHAPFPAQANLCMKTKVFHARHKANEPLSGKIDLNLLTCNGCGGQCTSGQPSQQLRHNWIVRAPSSVRCDRNHNHGAYARSQLKSFLSDVRHKLDSGVLSRVKVMLFTSSHGSRKPSGCYSRRITSPLDNEQPLTPFTTAQFSTKRARCRWTWGLPSRFAYVMYDSFIGSFSSER